MQHSIHVPSEIAHKWQDIADLLAAIMNIPCVMVTRAEPAAITVFVSSMPDDDTFGAGRVDTEAFCKTVIETREPLFVGDARENDKWQSSAHTKLKTISYLGVPIIWPDGQIFGTMCARDIKRNAYSELHLKLLLQFSDVLQGDLRSLTLSEINERFRVLAESSLSGIYFIQEDLYRYVNPAMARMFGYAVADLVNRLGPRDLVYPDDRPLVLENIRRRIEGDVEGIRYECRGLRKDGSTFPVEVHGRRVEHGGRAGIVGTLVDNTDRHRAEDELRASEEALRDYAEIASDWFWESGPDHRFCHFSGKSPDWGVSGKFIGSTRWELAADREDEPEKWHAHLAVLDAHQPFRGFKYRIARPDGSPLYVSVGGKPLFAADGKFLGYRGTASDVTAEVRAEQAEHALREAQAQLAHVSRVMTVGELSASIAHELNQPMAAIMSDATAAMNWLARPSPDLAEARDALEHIVKSTSRAGQVIERVRAHIKKAPVQKIELDINEVILEVTALIRAEIQRNHVTLRTELADDLPPVQTDRIEFQQIMLNLMINAIEAMQGSVRRDLLIASKKEDSQVRVEVCDSGQGVEPETADRIFQPFFTTKPGGMGMGLAICRTIIARLGGKLAARANAPCGTVFEFSIPLDPRAFSA